MSLLSEQMHDMISNLDARSLTKIKEDEELLCLWRDVGNEFIFACHLVVERGGDPSEQAVLIALQEQLQTL